MVGLSAGQAPSGRLGNDGSSPAPGIHVPAPPRRPHVAGNEREGTVEVLIPEAQLQARVQALGQMIAAAYTEITPREMPVLVGILRGSVLFTADLLRAIAIDFAVDFLAISSYVGCDSSGVVRLTKDLDHAITGRHVLIVEDIIDTGLTLRYVLRSLRTRNPASLAVCTLLNKPVRRLTDLPVQYTGFDIPDVFVVGYGLDYQQRYRELPYIGTLHLP